MVLTPDGKVARYFYGVEYPPRDLRLGLIEAADGTIGSPVDQVLLYCFQYDPASGTYAAATLNMVRLGGVATLLALGGFVLLSRRRERRRGT
jgi:protein SCO1/2